MNYVETSTQQQVGTERAGFLDLQTMNSIKPRHDILWALKTILSDLNVQEYKGLIDYIMVHQYNETPGSFLKG